MTKLPDRDAKALLDKDCFPGRDAAAPTPVPDSALTDAKSLRELGGVARFANSSIDRVHKRICAPTVHILARGFVHRLANTAGAPCRAMQVLILSDSDYRIAVGHRLRRLIKACRLKQVEAADAMGVTRNHLGNWLRGDAYPNPYAIYKFCRSQGVNTDYIYLGDYSALPKRIGDAVEKAELAQAGLLEPDHQLDES